MINAAIVGLGWWGKTLVEAAEKSDAIRFISGATRTVTPDIEGFAKKSGFKLAANYEAVLADPDIDAGVLATPHSMHGAQVGRGRGGEETHLLREAVHAHQRGSRERRRRGQESRRHAGARL